MSNDFDTDDEKAVIDTDTEDALDEDAIDPLDEEEEDSTLNLYDDGIEEGEYSY